MKSMLRMINQHRACEEFTSENVVRSFWKSFSILDCIGYVEESWKQISEKTINRSWSKLLPEFVVDPRKPDNEVVESDLPYEEHVADVVKIAQVVGGEGFNDVDRTEILELILPGSEVLSVQDVEEIVNQQEEPEEESKESDSPKFHFSSLKKIINLTQNAIDEAMSQDPIMTRCLNFKHNCELAIQIYEELYKDYLRKMRQPNLFEFFKKYVTW